MEWAELRTEIVAATAGVGDLLRSAPSAATPVPRLSWSVGELGAHLVSIPRRYRRMLREPTPFPERLSELNESELRAVEASDPPAQADVLHEETAELLGLLGDDGERPVPFFGMQHTVAGVGGVLLGELLVHGLDLAGATGTGGWRLQRGQAVAVMDGLLPSLRHSFDPDVAARAVGTYHLHLRGGADWTIRVQDRDVRIDRGRPERADLHVSADPVAFLLVGYQRASRARAVLTGRMAAWGRKPWLAAPFGRLFTET